DGNPWLYPVLQAFERATGCPVMVNTSFNVRGEPIVCTPVDAYRCFMRTEIDLLVLENYLVYKNQQTPAQSNTGAFTTRPALVRIGVGSRLFLDGIVADAISASEAARMGDCASPGFRSR